MILTRNEIVRQVEAGTITIDPFTRDQLNPVSYNYRLGERLVCLPREASLGDVGSVGEAVTIPPEGVLLQPGRLYLGATQERIGSATYVPCLIGRSSVGRLGLFLQLSADLGNLGSAHCWTLELTAVQPIVVYAGMLIGQVSFWRPKGERTFYHGGYTSSSEPTGNQRHFREVT